MKKFKKLSAVLSLVLCVATIILSTGCSKPVDNNKQSIFAVIRSMFTCPDKEFVELIPYSKIGLGVPEEEKQPDDKEILKYNKKLDEMYLPYFTKKGYEKFSSSLDSFNYHVMCFNSGYRIEVKQIEAVPDKDEGTNYTVIVTLSYGKNTDNQTQLKVTGRVRCDEEGKIGYIKIDSNSQKELYEKIK